MRRRVGVFKALGRHMRVDLRGRKIRVSQKLLHAPQVRAPVEHMRREGVTERVRRNFFTKPRPLHVF